MAATVTEDDSDDDYETELTDDLETEASIVQSNVTQIEATMNTHKVACLNQKFTRLPCIAHKVKTTINKQYYTNYEDRRVK